MPPIHRPVIAAAIVAAGCAQPHTSPYVANECPLPAGAHGFPVTARSTAPLPSPTLTAIAGAIADRWPQAKPRSDTTLSLAQLFLLADSTRPRYVYSRGDWSPAFGDSARLRVVYHRGAGAPSFSLDVGDPRGNLARRALRSAIVARQESEARVSSEDTLPLRVPIPDGADSVVVSVDFGREPQAGDGVVHFARQERAVRPLPGPFAFPYPEHARDRHEEADLRATFVVGIDGAAVPVTVSITGSPSPEFRDVVRSGLRTTRYLPAQLDCATVPFLVQQPFAFRIGRPNTLR